MNILKRQLALLLVFAMTLTMLPMPAHADEVTEPETPPAIAEETTEKTIVSNEEVSTTVANKPVENTKPDTVAPAAETPTDSTVDPNAANTEEQATDVSDDTPESESVKESEDVIETDDAAENTEIEENADSDSVVDAEEGAAEHDESENTEDSEVDAPVLMMFSLRRRAANSVANECEHPATEAAWDTNYTVTYSPVDGTQHRVSGYQNYYCTSCYNRVGESFAATELDGHELDSDGYCSLCGYRSNSGSGTGSGTGTGSDSGSDPDCDHPNTAIGWDPDQLGPWYAQYSDTQHKVTGFRYTYCTSCHARIRDESGSNNNYYSEEVEGHTLNASGECTLCGYGQKSTCNHLRDSSSGEVSYTDPPRYEKCNADTHYIYRPTYYDCIYCQEPMEEPGYTISNEPHAPENGVCIHCGYEVGEDYCAHSETETAWDTAQPIYYSIYSATQHQIRGFEYTYCTSCFERIGDSFWSQQQEGHTLNDDGVCSLCSYGSNTCAHENVVFGYAPVYDPPRYEQYSDSQHFVYHIMQKTCRDCGEKLSDGEEAGSLEDHVLDDGKCTYCGYGLGENYCTHPGTDVAWDTNYPITYVKINNEDVSGTLHQAEGYQYHYCTSCYKRICDSFPVAEWENHTFDSAGDCTLCDYRVGCEHKKTTMKLYDTLYESLNKDSHEVTRLYSKVCADPECGKVLVSVETSYTETDIEDHDFTGNTCLLCNYTVAAQLSATVTASAQTANKGDHISATATVVGGTGGYRFSWKILKDGSVVAENPITTSASCGINAYEEGTYVFQVTVTDSGSNTITAQSGAITVKHECSFETIIVSTKLVNQSLTHHTTETSAYEECSVCHEKTETVDEVVWEEHIFEGEDHEKAHPHQKYQICKCGAHPYIDGEYETANGKVQDKSVCCICHGHKYGEAQETADGTWKKTCANCGLSQKVTAPVQPTEPVVPETEPEEEEEKHVHTYVLDKSNADEHPHTCIGTCFCKATIEYNSYSSSCCKCTGVHIWGDAIRLPDGSFKEVCSSCNTTQTATPSGKVQNYYDVIDIIINRKDAAAALNEMETGNFALWKEVAVEAAEKLTDGGFVFSTNFIDALSDQKGTIVDAVNDTVHDAILIDKDTWDYQQTEIWEKLILELLHKQDEIMENADTDSALLIEGSEGSSTILTLMEKVSEEKLEKLAKDLEKAKGKIEKNDVNASISIAKDAKTLLKELNNLTTAIGVFANGTSAMQVVNQQNAILVEIKNGEEYKTILDNIYKAAKASGNKNLANAVLNVYDEIDRNIEDAFALWLDSMTALTTSMAGAIIEEASEKGLEIALEKGAEAASSAIKKISGGKYGTADVSFNLLEAIEIGATAAKFILGYDKVYQEAELLMTYNQMDTTMDIVQVLKEEDAPYMMDLWGLLQAEGCNQAQVFLDVWESGVGLKETELGIKEGGISAVNKALDKDRNYYIDELDLPLEKSK